MNLEVTKQILFGIGAFVAADGAYDLGGTSALVLAIGVTLMTIGVFAR